MNFDSFVAILTILMPNMSLGEDNEGQLIIYTNLRLDGDEVVEIEWDA